MNERAYRVAEEAFWKASGLPIPAERRISLPRLGLGVRIMEVGEGPELLFLHGGPNAGSTWAPLVAHLDGFRCLLVDRPGCGLSSPPTHPPRSVRTFVSDMVADLLDTMGESVVGIVASSFGSYSSLLHAVAHPEATRPAVHFGCPALAPGSKAPLRFLLQMLPGFRQLLIRLDPPTVANARKAFSMIGHQTSMAAGKIPAVGFEWYAALLEHTDTRENDLRLFGRIRPRDQLTESDLAAVRTRSSFFWGLDDTFGGGDVAQRVAGAMPDAALELVADSGHLPWMDAPAEAAEHVRTFFSHGSAS